MSNILVTGGAGYIGSHTVLALLESGYDVIILDNLINSSKESLVRVNQIAGRVAKFIKGDLGDNRLLKKIFHDQKIDAVMHFAGLKSVSESVYSPIEYYESNLSRSISLFKIMGEEKVYNLIFSSSATVYGSPPEMPCREDFPKGFPATVYGRSKMMVEDVLFDLARSDPRWSIAILRYFNPVGAHPSGLIGEDPNGVPNNLIPYLSQVAIGLFPVLSVFGADYPTPDGTGLRDYIHVVDLAKGHLEAMQAISDSKGIHVWNLGTGRSASVMELISLFEQVSGRSIPFKIVPRRTGDLAEVWADTTKASKELGWRAEKTLRDMIEDAWRWQTMNPGGYTKNGC